MKKLLERWAELEPGECERCIPPSLGAFALSCGDEHWSFIRPHDLPIVLYAVLMCCEKRGWAALVNSKVPGEDVRSIWPDNKAWHANVDICPLKMVYADMESSWLIRAFSDSPAEAALSAYIKALEASVNQTTKPKSK